jgi:hypothetical protein
VDPDALEHRTKPPFAGAPTAYDVFAYREHAACRVAGAGVCLVGKVRTTSVPESVSHSGRSNVLFFRLVACGGT